LKEVGYAESIDSELTEDKTIGMAVDMCEEGKKALEENKNLHKALEDRDKLIEDMKNSLYYKIFM
jgi:hypothetical protein